MSKVDFNEGVTGILMQDWHGMERGSDSWCQEQVQLLTDRLLEETDLEGIRAILYEMSKKNLSEASMYAARIIEHLFKIKFCPNSTAVGHWKREINSFMINLVEIFDGNQNRDLLTTYRSDFESKMWRVAKKAYTMDAKEYEDLVPGLDRIPEECPFTPEDLMELSINDLLGKLD